MMPLKSILTTAICCFLTLSIYSQELILPYEIQEYYPDLKEFNPGKAIALQEWRRVKGAEEITKGFGLTYDDKGRISKIITPDKITWTYLYDTKNRPEQIISTDEFGEQEVHTFYYRRTNFEWIRRDSHKDYIAEKTIYFYDKRRRIVEEKIYSHDFDYDSLMLDERTVRTFLGPTDERIAGEMSYIYFPPWNDRKGYVNQGKTIYLYDGVTGKIRTKINYQRVDNPGKNPLQPGQLSRIRDKEHYLYDKEDRLVEIYTTDRSEEDIYDRKKYVYNGDYLEEYTVDHIDTDGTADLAKGTSYRNTRLLFNKEGLPLSLYSKSVYDNDFRASFTMRELKNP